MHVDGERGALPARCLSCVFGQLLGLRVTDWVLHAFVEGWRSWEKGVSFSCKSVVVGTVLYWLGRYAPSPVRPSYPLLLLGLPTCSGVVISPLVRGGLVKEPATTTCTHGATVAHT